MSKEKRMRDDPNQTKAAEALAIAAGFDPHERVPKVGTNKTMPRWTLFIEQARQIEDSRRRADEAAASPPPIAPQGEQYQNAPLKVFGQHDQGTLDQMRACMEVGNVVRGVICADGHLGYAQPVGGVIAYEDQVSISGVGFDIGCVDRDTEFLTLVDGLPTWLPIHQWEKHQVCVFEPSTGSGWFEEPSGYVNRPSAGFYHLDTKYGIDQMLSADHRMLLYPPGPERAFSQYVVMRAEDFVKKHNSLVQGHDYRINTTFRLASSSLLNDVPFLGVATLTITGLNITDDQIRLVVAVCADGCFEKREGVQTNIAILSFKKERKIERMREILRDEQYTVSSNEDTGYTTFRVKMPSISKDMRSLLGQASPCQLEVIAQEVLHWDGTEEDNVFFTRDRTNADFVSFVFAATGRRSVLREDVDKSDYRVYAHSNTKTGMKAVPHNKIEFVPSPDGMEYCFTVSTGFFVIRRNGVVAMTGNCGNMAIKLDTQFTDLDGRVPQILADISRVISFGVGRTNDERVEHAMFDDGDAWREADMEEYRKKAVTQLGTVGGGNHYVDLMYDIVTGNVWIGVHFGSRGLGHTSATRYLKAAGGKDGMHVPPAVVDLNSEIGRRYIAAMELAGRYSYAGREWVTERVRKIVGGTQLDMVHNHHNYAWLEKHDGKELFVVRKGATPAFPGQRGFVGGSMGDDAVIIEGVDGPEARAALYSTVHGAGRLHGRKEAKRRFTRAEMDAWLKERGVMVAGGDIDESPQAYRRLPDVLAAQGDTIKIRHRLRPFAVAMAGDGEYDPWKD
jgi:tRNA-splicing ligase RtcB